MRGGKTLTACIGSTDADINNCTLYVAQYDKHNVLLSADWSTAKEPLSITVADDAAYIKAFLWEDMSPASAAAKLTIEE